MAQAKPARYLMRCGHPADQTLDLKDLDGVICSYCIGCLIEKVGLRPIRRFRLHVEGKRVKIIDLPLEEK